MGINKGLYQGLIMIAAAVLTARAGKITYNGHTESWYDLPMQKVIERSDAATGLSDMYWIRGDGVRMYGQWVIVAAHPSVTRYSLVETSLGTGIVLDRHTVPDANLYDIATDWKE